MDWKSITIRGITVEVNRAGQVRIPERSIECIRDGKPFVFVRPPHLVSPYVAQHGYLEVAPQVNRLRRKLLVHRLVGEAFVPGYDQKLSINHINGDKTDNRPENLEWVSLAANTEHQWRIGLADLRGENQPTHKLTEKQVRYIRRMLSKGISAHSISVVAGVSDSLIALIRDRKRWAHI